MSRALRALTERAPHRSRTLIPLRARQSHDEAAPENITIERKGRKGRRVGQPFFAASAAFAFHRRRPLDTLLVATILLIPAVITSSAQSLESLPELTQPVNDFAHVIDPSSAAEIDRISRALLAATGDTVVVATVETFQPYADTAEMAVKMFENHGRGIGDKDKDNGLLILIAVKERGIKIEVGYGLEQWITDGYAGETIRLVMAPEFRAGR